MFQVLIAAGMAVLQWILPRLLSVAGTVAISETVIKPIFDFIQGQVMQKLNGMSADAVHFLQFAGVFDAVSVIFSAYALAIGMKAAKSAFARNGAKGNV